MRSRNLRFSSRPTRHRRAHHSITSLTAAGSEAAAAAMSSSVPSLLPDATRDLARFAAATRFEQIPADVLERIKLSLLDGLGVCLHGSTLPWTRIVHDIVCEEGGKPVASIWGSGVRTSLTNAVLANSTAGHAFEMDDIHKESIVHPNSLAVPVALALAEADPSLTGREVALALAVGYEIGLRIGNAATQSLFLSGFHPQGTSGAFVAAATAGKLLRLNAEQMQNTLGIAGSTRLHRDLRCRRGRLWGIPELVFASTQPGTTIGGTGKGLGGRQGRLQDVSQRHQHSRSPRRVPVDPHRGEGRCIRYQPNSCRLRSHDLRPYRMGLSARRGHGRADEHVLRPQRHGAPEGRLGCRL